MRISEIVQTEEKKKGLEGKACCKGYRIDLTKMKGGNRVDNCIPIKNEAKEKTK